MEVYILEERVYSDEKNEFRESSWHWSFVDVMSYETLIVFLAKNHLNWMIAKGIIRDNAGFEVYRISHKKV